MSNEGRKSILKAQPRFSYAHHFSFHSQNHSNSNKSKFDKESSYNDSEIKYIHEAFKVFREMPESFSSDFAKIVSEKIKKSEYSPLAGLVKKIGSPRRDCLIKPYLLKEDKEENTKDSSNLKEDFRKQIYNKISSMQKDISSLISASVTDQKKSGKKNVLPKSSFEKKENEGQNNEMSKFIDSKERLFNKSKKNLHITALSFDEEESLLALALVNCEIRVKMNIK